MEFLNKVELKGVVGRTIIQSYGSNVVLGFSVVTEYLDTDIVGNQFAETMWWSCTKIYTEVNPNIPIDKGDKAHVIGRLRQRKYTDQSGNEKILYDVVVEKVEKIED